MRKLDGWMAKCTALALCTMAVTAAPAQSLTTLFSFDAFNGASPNGSLVQGHDGNFYGTTYGGGDLSCFLSGGFGYPYGCGTVFTITPQGKLKILYSFCAEAEGVGSNCNYGAYPLAGLVLSTDGEFYGTTYGNADAYCFNSDSATCGTIFKITHRGALTMLYRFCSQQSCPDGLGIKAGVTEARYGSFYGTAGYGGAYGQGTVFRVTSGGSLTTLYSFCARANCSDGGFPQTGIIQATDGNFYGTNTLGADSQYCFGGCGTVFKMTPSGNLTTLHDFCQQPNCTDGFFPGGLVEAIDGNFYGVTAYGGAYDGGTVFEVTRSGKFALLYSFCSQPGCTDGFRPYPGLIQATDGDLYGTAGAGGDTLYCGGIDDGCGTIFKITTSGAFTRLYSFSGADGGGPQGVLLQATDGGFYGTTNIGGNLDCGFNHYGCGTVFRLDVGLAPFVKFVRGDGKVGQTGGILGQGLTGTTSVSFNGTPANFTVVSDTYLKATVPPGATTGYVTVATPSGVLTSNVPFYVIQ